MKLKNNHFRRKIPAPKENTNRQLIVVCTGYIPLGQSSPEENIANEDVPPETRPQENMEDEVISLEPSAPEQNAPPSSIKAKADEIPSASNPEEGEITSLKPSASDKNDVVVMTNSSK